LPTVKAMEQRQEAVLITGVYGVGKSSAAEEIADVLEEKGASYAVLDLDWLGWFGPEDEVTHRRVLAENLAAVVENYRAVGVRWFVLAYAVADAAHLEHLKAVMRMPVKVVRLTVAFEEIARRPQSDVTTGRLNDLREAATWLATSRGAGIEELTMPNDRPIREWRRVSSTGSGGHDPAIAARSLFTHPVRRPEQSGSPRCGAAVPRSVNHHAGRRDGRCVGDQRLPGHGDDDVGHRQPAPVRGRRTASAGVLPVVRGPTSSTESYQ
jgi:hypothetical protein